MTTWTVVTDPGSTWNDASGYVFAGYTDDDYVLAYAESPSPAGIWQIQSSNVVSWIVEP